MAKIEVDEGEYNAMVALRGVATKIASNPQARKIFESAHKLVDPNASTPLTDQEAQQLAPVKEIEKKFSDELAALKKEREDEKKERTLGEIADRQTKALAQLRRDGYTDEGVAAIQKLMETKGLLDVDDAVAIFERQNPPPTPVTPVGGIGSWGFSDLSTESDESIKALISSKGEGGQADQIIDRMARTAIQEYRQARR